MKKVALISTFCDTKPKQEILQTNILKLKSLGVDVIALGPSNITLPEEITKSCDYFFYTKDNPILKWPVRQYTHWYRQFLSPNLKIYFHRGLADYGWAALFQTKKLLQIGFTFDYDIYYHLIYDTVIDEFIEQEISNNEVNLIHRRQNPKIPSEIWEATLHFISLDKETARKIEKEITQEEYLKQNGVAEGEVLKWRDKFGLKTSPHLVKDKIYYWGDYDFFDYRIFPEFKIFLSKNAPTEIWVNNETERQTLGSNLRMTFHGFETTIGEIKIRVNGVDYIKSPKPWECIEFPVDSQQITELIFEYQGKTVDYTNEYSQVMRNLIYLDETI